jgi:hypothetical protein
MKKMTLVLATASLIAIGTQSCKKEENHKPPITETYSVQLKANEAYTFSLPKNKRDDAYEITTQSTHYTISQVGKDASGNRIYQYTPALNYVGADQIVVANPKEDDQDHDNGGKPEHHHLLPPPHHGHGDCDGGEEDHYIITINFTIENTSVTSK